MIYFSELRNKEVITEDNVVVGKLNDLIFIVSEKPLITKLVVRAKDGKSLIIPVSYLRKINSHLIIRKEYKTIDLDVNELHVIKNLLDKQIIDLKGNKIVRANDVAIQDKGELFIAGVDIGILGVLRWLGLEKLSYAIFSIIHFRIISSFLSWADIQPLELARGEVRLRLKWEYEQRYRPGE